MTWRVIVGSISVIVTMILLGYVAVTEQTRMESFSVAFQARQIETGAAIFENNCRTCHGDTGQGVPGKGPALNYADMFNGVRTTEANWGGTVDNFVRLTIAAGRPQASAKYAEFPERMPTWSEQYGGPLRRDQVDALTAYVMNWAKTYEGQTGPTPEPIVPVGRDITIELPAGDAANGEKIATAQACTACHITAPTGPAWLASAYPTGEGIGTRAATRFTEEGYTGTATSAEQYLFESIVNPGAHLITDEPTFAPGGVSAMPAIYADKLEKQDVADLIAYLLTIK